MKTSFPKIKCRSVSSRWLRAGKMSTKPGPSKTNSSPQTSKPASSVTPEDISPCGNARTAIGRYPEGRFALLVILVIVNTHTTCFAIGQVNVFLMALALTGWLLVRPLFLSLSVRSGRLGGGQGKQCLPDGFQNRPGRIRGVQPQTAA